MTKTTLCISVLLIAIAAYFGFKLYEADLQLAALSNQTITPADVAPYLSGVVQLGCADTSGGDGGSGSLWNLPTLGYTVLTNNHVITDDDNGSKNEGVGSFDAEGNPITIQNACSVYPDATDTAPYYVGLKGKYQWNQQADAVDLPLRVNTGVADTSTPPLSSLNYSISNLRLCSPKIPVGSPMALIGYPAFGSVVTTSTTGASSTQYYEMMTEGMITGVLMNDPITDATLTYPDFFTSANMDQGSSGGIAFSKDANGLCILGIPSWNNPGVYENEGVIQNIRNVFLKG